MDLLGSVFRGQKVYRDLALGQQFQLKIMGKWEEIWGKLANQIKFEHLRDQILVVSTENPIWLNEIRYYKTDILIKINRFLEIENIKELKVKDLRVIVVSKEEIKNQKLSKKIVKDKSIEQLINEEIQDKKERGMVLCSRCKVVYTDSGICVFCRSGVN